MSGDNEWGAVTDRMDTAGPGVAVKVLVLDDYPHVDAPGATFEMARNWLRRQQKSLRIFLNEAAKERDHAAVVSIEDDTLYARWARPDEKITSRARRQ